MSRFAPPRSLNLGAAGNPAAFAVDALPGGNGDLGGLYEDSGRNAYQLFQLVDAGAVANDVQFAKSYTGAYLATPTIGNSSRNEACGVATTTVLVNQFTLLQIGGVRAVKFTGTDGPAQVRGSELIVDRVGANSTDTRAMAVAVVANTNNIVRIGIVQAASGGGNISALLTIQPT
jgi:hypothetical protein